ncbi:hypothetical protein K1719_021718 [Acacia pycnantha]|nr:hypothetical protein K1719_021718 [Acacia pycnantha]
MRKKRSEFLKSNENEGRGKRICSESGDENNFCNSFSVTNKKLNKLTMNCFGEISHNDLSSSQSSLLNPLSEDNIQPVLSDITNTPSSSNYMQSNISSLTYRSKLTLSPSVHPPSQSVNQKKSVKKSSKQIRQVATDLCSRLNPPVYQNSRVTKDQHDRTNHHNKAENNLSSMLRSTYLDDGDACHECQVRGAEMWLAERLKGQNHHLIGSLLPTQGNPPVYAQPYIYNTENEISNRISTVSRHVGAENLDHNIVEMLKECLDKHNCVVKHYRKAAEIIKENVIHDVSIRLIRSSNSSGLSKQYNMPTTTELAALIVGDFDNSYTKRDIIVKRQCGELQRIDELHMAYLPLQYPLLFPYGDNGYDSTNQHAQESLSATKKTKKLTPREYLEFRLMRRKSERSVILHGKKLLQQFIVDGYSMVESDRLDYIRKHQKELRVDLYSGLTDALTRGETNPSSTGQ